ncbi:hypothetical protein S245_000899, partial [Arachis hypogaea]
MATPFNMQHQLFHHLSFGLDIRKNLIVYSLQHAKLKKVEGSLNNGLLVGSLSRYYTSLREFSSLAESVKTHFSCIEGVEFNRVEYIVSVLHESARSFSKAVESLGVSRCGPELTMAWIGKDVHEWHRRIAYQVHEIGIYGSQLLASLLLPHHSPILSSNSDVCGVPQVAVPTRDAALMNLKLIVLGIWTNTRLLGLQGKASSHCLPYFESLGFTLARYLSSQNLPSLMHKALRLKCLALSHLIDSFPRLLSLSLDNHIIPIIDFLHNIGVPRVHITTIILSFPPILFSNIQLLKARLLALKQIHVVDKDYIKLLIRYPWVLSTSIQENYEEVHGFFLSEKVRKICIDSAIRGQPYLLGCSTDKLKSMLDQLADLGVKGNKLDRVIAKSPQLLLCSKKLLGEFFLAASINKTLKRKIEFLSDLPGADVPDEVRTFGERDCARFLRSSECVGLLSITKDKKVELLTDEVDGLKFKLTDGVDIAKDGTIYFTDASYKYLLKDRFLDLLEGKPHGRFMSYDPTTKKTEVLVHNLYFPNGVAVSPDQQFVIFFESVQMKCKKYYIEGPKKGSVEKFCDNLPGYPDNIHYDEQGINPRTGYNIQIPFDSEGFRNVCKVCNKNEGIISVDLDGKPIGHYSDPKLAFASGIKI